MQSGFTGRLSAPSPLGRCPVDWPSQCHLSPPSGPGHPGSKQATRSPPNADGGQRRQGMEVPGPPEPMRPGQGVQKTSAWELGRKGTGSPSSRHAVFTQAPWSPCKGVRRGEGPGGTENGGAAGRGDKPSVFRPARPAGFSAVQLLISQSLEIPQGGRSRAPRRVGNEENRRAQRGTREPERLGRRGPQPPWGGEGASPIV